MTGDINANLAYPEGTPRYEAITENLVAAGLEDMGMHFLPHSKLWLQYMCTWSMRRDGGDVWSRTYYILRIDRRLFQDVAIRDPRKNSDHYMVLGCLRGEPVRGLTDYLRKARRFSLLPIHRDLASTSYKLVSDINT